MTPKETILSFWQAMNSNDFHKASRWLSEDFQCIWPQSSEVIQGPQNFAELNAHYPSQGKWKFVVNEIIEENGKVVTDVSVSDGVQAARAITFHTVEKGLIQKQVEFWPDNYDAPAWRKKWVQICQDI